jgi:hypothetical protein
MTIDIEGRRAELARLEGNLAKAKTLEECLQALIVETSPSSPRQWISLPDFDDGGSFEP